MPLLKRAAPFDNPDWIFESQRSSRKSGPWIRFMSADVHKCSQVFWRNRSAKRL